MEYSSGQSAPIAELCEASEAAGCSKSSTSDGGGATSGPASRVWATQLHSGSRCFFTKRCARLLMQWA